MNKEKTAGVAIQDVDAPVSIVLHQIADTQSYTGKVPGLLASDVYATKSLRDGATEVKARLVLELAFGYKLEYYSKHVFSPRNRCLTWTLDYDRKSDLYDSVGYWRVDAIAGEPARCRVFYSTSSLVRGLPGFVMDLVTAQALKSSTAWVKKHSELAAGASSGRGNTAPAPAPSCKNGSSKLIDLLTWSKLPGLLLLTVALCIYCTSPTAVNIYY
mmetsp:Transcript_7584/g.22182  ORF Transcript_7584/g.22182 Transcript_7584/m.22182 type:complete len:215 (+) Transcript_7584:310-954(+)